MTLSLSARTYWSPKSGNSEVEYEDAFYPENRWDRKGRSWRFSVADGASEGMLSGPWAKILVRSFCRAPQRPTRASARLVVARACDSWEAWKASYLRRRAELGRPIQWWEEEGLSAGPFATLLGVAFLLREGTETGRFDAVALGDTCLFKVGGGELAVRFPIESSSEFGSRPVLLSGNPVKNVPALGRVREVHGPLSRGDAFYLMTDALAQWFLREAEAGGCPWTTLDALDSVGPADQEPADKERAVEELASAREELENPEDSEERFIHLVNRLRETGVMRNDDVTLTCIKVV